jgi:ubiquinol-cytochrome c reductase cytochrome c1 subunit
MKILTRLIALTIAALLAAPSVAAAAGARELEPAGINVNDMRSLQRGAKLFVNYCLSCHSAAYMRYNRLAEDLQLTEEVVMENMVFADKKIGETMSIAMDPEDSEQWFGKTPPDLSLAGRSRGADWLYAYMRSFYQDESGRWNNLILPNAAMPHVLWELQGIQKLVAGPDGDAGHGAGGAGHLEVTVPGSMTADEYDEAMRDLAAFLDYMSEPAKLKRKNIGVWVILFLAVFAFLAYLLKAEYWRDVH